jgi:hypothetical protein
MRKCAGGRERKISHALGSGLGQRSEPRHDQNNTHSDNDELRVSCHIYGAFNHLEGLVGEVSLHELASLANQSTLPKQPDCYRIWTKWQAHHPSEKNRDVSVSRSDRLLDDVLWRPDFRFEALDRKIRFQRRTNDVER